MKTWALIMALAAVAGAADLAGVRAAPVAAAPEGVRGQPSDAQLELSWDSGGVGGAWAYFTGLNEWGANDFNISTLAAYNYVASGRIYYYPNWPNNIFEGNREGVWSFVGGTPGSLLWGPQYVRGTAFGWNSYAVGWTLGAVTAFVMAFEQYYDYPNCDPVLNCCQLFGTGGHSWYYYNGAWHPWSEFGIGNWGLMIRCIVDNSYSGVTPASLGRVKALYR